MEPNYNLKSDSGFYPPLPLIINYYKLQRTSFSSLIDPSSCESALCLVSALPSVLESTFLWTRTGKLQSNWHTVYFVISSSNLILLLFQLNSRCYPELFKNHLLTTLYVLFICPCVYHFALLKNIADKFKMLSTFLSCYFWFLCLALFATTHKSESTD